MIRILFAVFAASLLVVPAHAHRQPEVETTVEAVEGPDGPRLGITHRLHAHDAMTLLRALGARQPDLTDARQLAMIADYAAGTLTLTGKALSEPLGAEVEGNYVFAYVRHPEMAAVQGGAMLEGVLPGWRHTVHAKAGDGRTLASETFHADHRRIMQGLPPLQPAVLPKPRD